MKRGGVLIFRPTSNHKQSGFSLVELTISTGLLLLLMTLIFALYFNSHRAWKKNSDHQEIMGDMQVAMAFFTDDLQSSSFDSVSVTADNAAIGLLTMKDNNGKRHYGPDGRPIWNHWVLYYADNQRLLRQDVPFPADEATRQTPVTVNAFSGQPLSAFLTSDGRALTRNLQSFSVEIPPSSRLVTYSVTIERPGRTNQTLTLEGSIRPRN